MHMYIRTHTHTHTDTPKLFACTMHDSCTYIHQCHYCRYTVYSFLNTNREGWVATITAWQVPKSMGNHLRCLALGARSITTSCAKNYVTSLCNRLLLCLYLRQGTQLKDILHYTWLWYTSTHMYTDSAYYKCNMQTVSTALQLSASSKEV